MKESITHFCKEYGPISGLVNNAGVSKDGLILRNKEEDIQIPGSVNMDGKIFVNILQELSDIIEYPGVPNSIKYSLLNL